MFRASLLLFLLEAVVAAVDGGGGGGGGGYGRGVGGIEYTDPFKYFQACRENARSGAVRCNTYACYTK